MDEITAKPDITGEYGKAWKCDLDEARRIMGKNPSDDATLIHWLVEAPWAHPAWHSYSLVLIHLRPMDDSRETKFYLPCASHELWVYAVNPDANRQEMITEGFVEGMWLSPKNFAAQIVELNDEDALERIESTVHEICDGILSPDTDFIRDWISRYGNNMVKREYK